VFTGLDNRHKYISLETFKKSGEGVKTPVWFAQDGDVLYIYTDAGSWKVKRIRNNPRVRVALCTMRGRVTGPWMDGTAAIIEGDERIKADQLLDRKYLLKRLFNWARRQDQRTMIRIRQA
jgi:PPOX class probable F420-dependent enzyme